MNVAPAVTNQEKRETMAPKTFYFDGNLGRLEVTVKASKVHLFFVFESYATGTHA